MRITARRNSRSFAASLENSLPQNSVSLPPFLRRTAHRFPASLCICPSHGLPILKIPLKIDPLCFMPASDRGPPGKTERLSVAPLRVLSGTASARPSPKAALFPTPKTTAAAVCARLLPNSAASLSLSLRRIHSGKFSLRRAVQGEKIPGIFPLPPANKSLPFLFLPIDRGTRPFFLRIFPALRTNFPGRHLLPGNGRPASPRLCRDGSSQTSSAPRVSR